MFKFATMSALFVGCTAKVFVEDGYGNIVGRDVGPGNRGPGEACEPRKGQCKISSCNAYTLTCEAAEGVERTDQYGQSEVQWLHPEAQRIQFVRQYGRKLRGGQKAVTDADSKLATEEMVSAAAEDERKQPEDSSSRRLHHHHHNVGYVTRTYSRPGGFLTNHWSTVVPAVRFIPSSPVVPFQPVMPVMPNVVMPTGLYDANCYIHRGCMGGAGYSTNPFGTDSMGAGWYCLDGQPVNSATRFDACEIHTGCSAVHYDRRSQVWRCNA